MRRLTLSLIASCLTMSSLSAFAGETADRPTLLAVRGKQLLADDFSSPTLNPRWTVGKGKWAVVDGALKGLELADDKHSATVRTNLPHTDAVYQFDFKLAPDSKTIHLSLNAAKGHLARVMIMPGGFQVRKDASKTDPADKGVLLDSCKMAFEVGKTYTMLVECVGNEILARVDDKHFAFGADAKVAQAKANFGFPIAGEGTIDNVKVWEASAHPDWAKARQKLLVDHPEKMVVPARRAKPADDKPAR